MGEQTEMVQISSGLVKLIAATIMTSLIAIAGYMLLWNRDDAAFKRGVTLQLDNIEDNIEEVKDTIAIVPANTQRINDLSERVRRLEGGEDIYRKSRKGREEE
jgi:hypothetical protein